MAHILTNNAFDYFITIPLIMIVPLAMLVAIVSYISD